MNREERKAEIARLAYEIQQLKKRSNNTNRFLIKLSTKHHGIYNILTLGQLSKWNKTIELRKWNTKIRGTFLVHASKVPFESGYNKSRLGCIVGMANLIDVKNQNLKNGLLDFQRRLSN